MELTQQETQQLFELAKIPSILNATVDFPMLGERVEIELRGEHNSRILFQADVNRKNQIAEKLTLQLRHRNTNVIRRVDFIGNHKNPPGPCPDPMFSGYEEYEFRRQDHVHFYMERYGDRWALPLDQIHGLIIDKNANIYERMIAFFRYCNVTKMEQSIQKTLFL